MTLRSVWVSLGMLIWIFGLAVLIYLLDFGKIRPITDAQMITQVALCEMPDCSASIPQALPYFSRTGFNAETESRHLRVILDQDELPEGVQALYLPKLSDNLDLRINGQLVHTQTLPQRLWNTPLLIQIPQALVQTWQLRLDITLYGKASEGLDLQPFYYAPVHVLTPYYAWRYFWGPGLAHFATGLMIVLAASLMVIWTFRRTELEYFWLGLACGTATVFLCHYDYGIPFGGYKFWTMLWLLGVSLYVLLILKFLRRFLHFTLTWPERAHAVALGGMSVVIMLSQPGYAFVLSIWSNILITVPSGFAVLVILWLNRSLLTPLDMSVFFGCLSISLALGLYELYLLNTDIPARTMHLFHLMPLVMSLACLWLILSRLIHSLRGYEILTASLNETIAQKSAELEASFARLTDIRRREAVAEERERIMLDLHDGIGGQLVNTLAYMQNNKAGDDTIRRALEDALRDLALMLDSMENHDSLVALLGMLRTRLEGLMSEHGVEFNWKIHDEPVLPDPGPSQSLHLARIVQEAITNVIKHTKADTITVYVDKSRISISDNGQGFDLDKQLTKGRRSHGIANMRRRSAAIGAEFDIVSDASGTRVSLLFNPST